MSENIIIERSLKPADLKLVLGLMSKCSLLGQTLYMINGIINIKDKCNGVVGRPYAINPFDSQCLDGFVYVMYNASENIKKIDTSGRKSMILYRRTDDIISIIINDNEYVLFTRVAEAPDDVIDNWDKLRIGSSLDKIPNDILNHMRDNHVIILQKDDFKVRVAKSLFPELKYQRTINSYTIHYHIDVEENNVGLNELTIHVNVSDQLFIHLFKFKNYRC